MITHDIHEPAFMDDGLCYIDPNKIDVGRVVYLEYGPEGDRTRIQGTVVGLGWKYAVVESLNYVTGDTETFIAHTQELA